MANRTFAIGDIHGDLHQLLVLLGRLPTLDAGDTIVFLGDYVDRGSQSAQVVEYVRRLLPSQTPAKVVALRGNHEDAWLRVIDGQFPEFVMPPANGCLACYASYVEGAPPTEMSRDIFAKLVKGSFFPAEHVEFFRGLPHHYEDDHAIYVHAGLPQLDGKWLHPSEVENKLVLLWLRTEQFFREYRGKRVVVGHTATTDLPQELSAYTPDDPTDLWAGDNVIAIDTGCGKGGFLTAIELPALRVYESR